MKKLEAEKENIKLRGGANNGSVASRLNSRYNVNLPLMSSSKSVRNMRGLDDSLFSRGGGLSLHN